MCISFIFNYIYEARETPVLKYIHKHFYISTSMEKEKLLLQALMMMEADRAKM